MRNEKLLIKQIICKIRQFTKLHLENNDSEWNQNTYAVLICKNHPGWESKNLRRCFLLQHRVPWELSVTVLNAVVKTATQGRQEREEGRRGAACTSLLLRPQCPCITGSTSVPDDWTTLREKTTNKECTLYWSHLEDFPLPHSCTSRYTGVN